MPLRFRPTLSVTVWKDPLVSLMAGLARPALIPGTRMVNRFNYWWGQKPPGKPGRPRALVPYSFWPPAAFSGYHAMFPEGVETFQAFVPQQAAPDTFKEVLRYSQKQGCMPLWCIIKQHRRDPFLLSYQLDGFSLELNYSRTRPAGPAVEADAPVYDLNSDRCRREVLSRQGSFSDSRSISPERRGGSGGDLPPAQGPI